MRTEKTLSIVLIVVGVILIAMGSAIGMTQIVLGILMLVLNTTFWTKPFLILHNDYLEMKGAPLAAKQLIRYGNIKEIARPTPKKAHIMVAQNSTEKKINLPLVLLEETERENLINTLQSRISNS